MFSKKKFSFLNINKRYATLDKKMGKSDSKFKLQLLVDVHWSLLQIYHIVLFIYFFL